jgi:hypothetical protein
MVTPQRTQAKPHACRISSRCWLESNGNGGIMGKLMDGYPLAAPSRAIADRRYLGGVLPMSGSHRPFICTSLK